MAKIAVIIVNYGTADLALAAARSVLARQHGGHEVALHLVDNASPDGQGAWLASEIAARGWQERVILHAETENHGFGRGNNIVLEALAAAPTPPDYIFLLNPDAELENEALEILVAFLEAHPEAASAGAAIRKPGAEGLVTAAFRFPGLLSTFVSAATFGPITRLFPNAAIALAPNTGTQQVDWVAGAAVLTRFQAWAEQNFFDPTYFLYFEEVDLMLRTARAGWQCWYVPEARILHAEGAATGVKSHVARRRRPAYWYASWRHYFQKNHGRGYALATATAWCVGAAINFAVVPFLRRDPIAPLNFYRDFWAMAIRPLLGLRERPY